MTSRNLRQGLIVGFLLALALVAWPRSVCASETTWEIQISASVTGRDVAATITTKNTGLENAKAVSIDARFQGEQQSKAAADQVEPGQSAVAQFLFRLTEGAQGAWPLFVNIGYEGAGGGRYNTAAISDVRTATTVQSKLDIQISARPSARGSRVTVTLTSSDTQVKQVDVSCFCPAGLRARPESRRVTLKDGKGAAEFTVSNHAARAGGNYTVFIVAEYEADGVHTFTNQSISVRMPVWAPVLLWTLLISVLGVVAAIIFRKVRRAFGWTFNRAWVCIVLDILVLVGVEIFIICHCAPQHLITKTIATGGDMASHYYTVEYLRDVMLPRWHVTYWTPGNYAGFPILQMYFPLPFLLMVFLNVIMPLQVAFKLVTLLGTFLLPPAAYLMLRRMRVSFPGPAVGAVLMLLFLFNTTNSMWGGNILSTLAGEFSYSLSLALSLLLIGNLYRGCMENKYVVLNAFLVFLVGFSHGYTLLFAEAMSVFLVLTPEGFVRRVIYLAKVYALGFCLLAFWLVPLLAFGKWTTPYHLVWTLQSGETYLPNILVPALYGACIGAVGLLVCGFFTWRRDGAGLIHRLLYMMFGLACVVVMYILAPKLGVVDIRYVAYAHIIICLISAMAIGRAGRWMQQWGLGWTLLAPLTLAAIAWTTGEMTVPNPLAMFIKTIGEMPAPKRFQSNGVNTVPSWAKWNYEGFESKNAWPQFKNINEALQGNFQDPRVVFEHSSRHNQFGSTRAFESLPLFAGRATLEGLYMQASITAPYSFYIQSLVSREISAPFPQYLCSTMNYERAAPRLKLFNAGQLIIVSNEAKSALRKSPEFRLEKSFGDYDIWELTTNSNRYVVPLEYQPVRYTGSDWKRVFYRWFSRDKLPETHLVVAPAHASHFAAQTEDINNLPVRPINTSGAQVEETIGYGDIRIHTNWIGKPLLVKMSYHPNWRTDGAEGPYLVSPSFMLIYPTQENVRLYYSRGGPQKFGIVLSVIGWLVLLFNIPLPFGPERRSGWQRIAARWGIRLPMEPRLPFTLGPRTRWTIFIFALTAGAALAIVVCWHVYLNEPHRLFDRSVELKDAKDYEKARAGFEKVQEALPTANAGIMSAYYIGITYYLQGRNAEAITAFRELVDDYPQSNRTAESEYHIGLCLFKQGLEAEGIAQMRHVVERYPNSAWAGYAKERLNEHGALE